MLRHSKIVQQDTHMHTVLPCRSVLPHRKYRTHHNCVHRSGCLHRHPLLHSTIVQRGTYKNTVREHTPGHSDTHYHMHHSVLLCSTDPHNDRHTTLFPVDNNNHLPRRRSRSRM
jgi:hypothetical protein